MVKRKKSCVYCDNPAIRAREIFRSKLVRVFPTNIPIVLGHLLIIPVRHVALFGDLTPREQEAIFSVLEKTKQALKKEFGAQGFNVAWNESECAGQSIPHFHLHVLPRKKGDTGITVYEPRKFLYRPGSREVSQEAELNKVSSIVRKRFK